MKMDKKLSAKPPDPRLPLYLAVGSAPDSCYRLLLQAQHDPPPIWQILDLSLLCTPAVVTALTLLQVFIGGGEKSITGAHAEMAAD